MARSLHLGRAFGIPVSIHWTFLILIAYIVITQAMRGSGTEDILMAIAFVLCIFACVVMHELGHSLAARKYGIETRSITLLPIGGVASLEKIPEDPKEELVVSAAGPLVNVVLAILFYFILLVGNWMPDMSEVEEISLLSPSNFLFSLMVVNIILVVFNLIPAFPMDGGRMLRASLGFSMSRERATRIAVSVGTFFAIGFVFLGLMSNPFLIIIAIFVFLGARAEYDVVRSADLLADYKASDIALADYQVLKPEDSLQSAIEKLIKGRDERFLVMEGQSLKGVITKRDILRGVSEHGVNSAVSQSMSKEVQSIQKDTLLKEVYEMMKKTNYSFFPVMEGDQVSGVVEKDNLLEFVSIRSVLKEGAGK